MQQARINFSINKKRISREDIDMFLLSGNTMTNTAEVRLGLAGHRATIDHAFSPISAGDNLSYKTKQEELTRSVRVTIPIGQPSPSIIGRKILLRHHPDDKAVLIYRRCSGNSLHFVSFIAGSMYANTTCSKKFALGLIEVNFFFPHSSV